MSYFSNNTEDFLAQAGEVEQQDQAISLARLCDEHGIDFAKEVPAMGTGWYSTRVNLKTQALSDREKFNLIAEFRNLGVEGQHISFGNFFYTKA